MEQGTVITATTEDNFTNSPTNKTKAGSEADIARHYTGTNPHQNFIEEVDRYLRLIGTTQVKLATQMGMHSTVLNRKMSGRRGMPVSQIKELIKILVEWGGVSDTGQIEALLKIRNLNLTIFTVEDWNSSPLCQLANAPLFTNTGEIEPRVKLGKPGTDGSMVTPALVTLGGRNSTAKSNTPIVKLAKPLVPPHNLPLLTKSSFIGRKRELLHLSYMLTRDSDAVQPHETAVASTISPVRLLTLTGPGGVGKTRLALQLGAELLTHFTNGVYFVDLSDIRQPEQLMGAIARGLGLKEVSGLAIEHTVKNHLKTRNLLLILDNFEQLIDAALQVKELLEIAPALKVVVTSREALHLYDEQEYIIPLMSLPNLSPRRSLYLQTYQEQHEPSLTELASYEAIALFVQTAAKVRRDFALSEANSKSIAQICVKLEGLPLAIELAASQIKKLSPQEVLNKLSVVLELQDGLKDRPNRHQTLRGVIDWSYNLLRNQEKQLLKRLSVFASGFTFEAVEYICGDLIISANLKKRQVILYNLLGSLIDKNLVRVLEITSDIATSEAANTDEDSELEKPETRYAMLETIREYALEFLEETEEEATVIRKQHAQYYLKLAEEAEPRLRGGGQQIAWLNRLHNAHNNFRFALQWLIDREDAEMANQLASVISEYWLIRSHFTEGQQWLKLTLNLAEKYPVDAAIRAKAFKQAGRLSEKYDLAYSEKCYNQARSLYEETNDLEGLASCLLNLGNIYYINRLYHEARNFYLQAVDLLEGTNNFEWVLPLALNNLGNVEGVLDNFEAAYYFYEKSISISRKLKNYVSLAKTLLLLGRTSVQLNNFTKASIFLEESLEIYRNQENHHGIANVLFNLSVKNLYLKNYAEAKRYLHKALLLSETLQNFSLIEDWLVNYMVLAAHDEKFFTAFKLSKLVEEVSKVKQLFADTKDRLLYDETLDLIKSHLTDELREKAISEGLFIIKQRGTFIYNKALLELAFSSIQ